MSEQELPGPAVGEQLRALNGSVDRLLIMAMDHARAIDDVKADVRDVRADVRDVRAEVGQVRAEVGQVRAEVGQVRAEVGEVRADVREIRREVTGVHEAFTEHLGWHLGRE